MKEKIILLAITLIFFSCESKPDADSTSLYPFVQEATDLYLEIDIIESKFKNYDEAESRILSIKKDFVKELYISTKKSEGSPREWIDVSILALISNNKNEFQIWQVYPIKVRICCISNQSKGNNCNGSPPFPY